MNTDSMSESLNDAKILEKTENTLVIEFSVPKTSPYFDGHFPGFSLLPAVAQVELIIRYASEYLATGMDILEMKRIKFTKFIRPDKPIMLSLEKKDKTVIFKMLSPGDAQVYSSGTLVTSTRRESGA